MRNSLANSGKAGTLSSYMSPDRVLSNVLFSFVGLRLFSYRLLRVDQIRGKTNRAEKGGPSKTSR